jgi:hypothetical protein
LIGAFGVNGAALTWTLRVTVDAGLLVAAVWRVAGVPPPRLLGQRGGRAVTAVLVLAAAAAAVRALVPGVVLRVELLGVALLLFAVCAWRYVLSDAERAEVGRVLR